MQLLDFKMIENHPCSNPFCVDYILLKEWFEFFLMNCLRPSNKNHP
jgi:hypothetical protein